MGTNGRVRFSFMIGIKVVGVLHFDVFKTPECRAQRAAVVEYGA